MSKGKFALGTLFGAAAGLLAGILTAPKSGKETRADLKIKAEVIKGEATHRVEQAQTKATVVVDDVKGRATGVANDVRVKTEDLKDRTERAVDGARKGFTSNK